MQSCDAFTHVVSWPVLKHPRPAGRRRRRPRGLLLQLATHLCKRREADKRISFLKLPKICLPTAPQKCHDDDRLASAFVSRPPIEKGSHDDATEDIKARYGTEQSGVSCAPIAEGRSASTFGLFLPERHFAMKV